MQARTQENLRDGVQYIMDDHTRIRNLYNDFKRTTDTKSRSEIFHNFRVELSQHAAVEELVLYPMIRKVMTDADLDHALDEHQIMKNKLSELDGMNVTDAGFETKFNSLMADFNHHVTDEEQRLLPTFRKTQTSQDLDSLYTKLTMAKKTAPTYPHPGAPSKPPLNIANVAVGAAEQAGEKIRGVFKK